MKSMFLLPGYFKYASILLILVPVVVSTLDIVLFNNVFIQKTFLEFIVSLAFAFLVFSKYKDEDEMLQQIRLKTTTYSLLIGVFLIVTKPLLNYFLWNQINNFESAGGIIMTVMFFNVLLFYKARKQLKEALEHEK
ncbi:hypothetical protein H1R17_01110 [Flavobacterium sp. xlx-214]|uniref:hypothetical protein n=1 Tax=unclassified Flavobacterium TaxID=196869 RepID=UPI0013D638F6|nr:MULTISPECIES: hypothetical protein [unclassified Flavobacterium]MBA5792618.1 hypothetical protein [Flavobacterium sp. xlx-221]QMI83767.1 hypothetical protein H1R17_01110 [Flavobacterium sp. xlx-214]